MVEEIDVGHTFQVTNGSQSLPQLQNLGLKVDQATPGLVYQTQNIGQGAHEVIDVGDLTAPRWSLFLNPEENTHEMDIGKDVSAVFELMYTLEPGEWVIGPIGTGVTVYARSDQASSAPANQDLLVGLFET